MWSCVVRAAIADQSAVAACCIDTESLSETLGPRGTQYSKCSCASAVGGLAAAVCARLPPIRVFDVDVVAVVAALIIISSRRRRRRARHWGCADPQSDSDRVSIFFRSPRYRKYPFAVRTYI